MVKSASAAFGLGARGGGGGSAAGGHRLEWPEGDRVSTPSSKEARKVDPRSVVGEPVFKNLGQRWNEKIKSTSLYIIS